MVDDDDNKGSGLGTAAGVTAITAVGTAGVALADGALSARDSAHKKLEDQIKGTGEKKGLEATYLEESKNLKAGLTKAERKLLQGLSTDGTYKDLVKAVEAAKKTEGADTKALSDILEKIKPVAEHENAFFKVQRQLENTQQLQKNWKNAGWVERLELSVKRAPKKIALLAAPIIAGVSYLGIHQLTPSQKSALDGNGQSK